MIDLDLRAECATTFGVAVEFSDDDRGNCHFITESARLSFASLTDRGVHHEYDVVWVDGVRHL